MSQQRVATTSSSAQSSSTLVLSKAAIKELLPKTFFEAHLKEGCRPCGRGFNNARKTVLNTGVVSTQGICGSASVSLGSTAVVAAITAKPIVPAYDRPNQGTLEVSIQATPACASRHSRSTYSRPSPESKALSAWIMETVNSAGVLDLSSLCIEEGMAVWHVGAFVDVISDDGNLTDACLLAVCLALSDSWLPGVKITNTGTVVQTSARHTPVRMTGLLLPLSAVVMGSDLLVDPDSSESGSCDARVTIVYVSSISSGQAQVEGLRCLIHAPGGSPLSLDTLAKVRQLGQTRAVKLIGLLEMVRTASSSSAM